jgi:hypothetical protein
MGIPLNKGELLKAINSRFDRLFADLALVDPAKAGERTMEGHVRDTLMSVCDLVAYLIGWNQLVLKWLERDAARLPVDFPETGFKWNELGRLAGKFYADYEGIPYPQLLERLKTAKEEIVHAVEFRDDAELYGRAWYGKWTMGRMIQFNTSSPYANAHARLRKWRAAGGQAHD